MSSISFLCILCGKPSFNRAMSKDKIIGINPVLEALKAGRPVQRVLVVRPAETGPGCPDDPPPCPGECGAEVRFASREALNREAPGANHQGMIAIAAAKQYATLDEILRSPHSREKRRSFWSLTGSKTPAILAPFSGPLTLPASME